MRTAYVLILVMSSIACGARSSSSDEPASTIRPTHHHPIATSRPDAQRAFDRGFELVFAFNHEEAARSFQRAAELDPNSPMPHWGVAWAVGPNYNLDIDDPRAKLAWEAIAKARTLAANANDRERAYVDAMAIRYSSDPKADRAALARQYSDAMRGLTQKFPDDLDAATLYAESLMNLRAWKLWSLDGTPAEGTEVLVGVLESVLRRSPQHIGANHYYIHTVEASPRPERALASAIRLETLVPTEGHLVHMPAHIYARTGNHAGAARANFAGAEADRHYMKTAAPDSFYVMSYYTHNLHFLADSHMMQGRFVDAQAAAAELAERITPHTDMMPMGESMAVAPVSVLLRFNKHSDVLNAAAPPADRPVMTAWWHFARGVAFAKSGRPDDAEGERQALDKAISTVSDSALFGGTGLESARTVLSVAATVLDARIPAARGNHPAAIARWTAAVAAADRLPYDEPPVWFYPMRESLGAALLLASRPAEAERVFREDLKRHPHNARSLFGLMESVRMQGKPNDAAWIKYAVDEAWRNADTPMPTVDEL
jgi:hypothetical protein